MSRETLNEKGLDVKAVNGRFIYLGPNIKIEIFNDGTFFNRIEKRKIKNTTISLFDLPTYTEMKMTALLCRTIYDPRDLVDIFVIHKNGNSYLSFPKTECEVVDRLFSARVQEIKETKKKDLFLFQTKEQIESLPFNEFEKFQRWLCEWLSKFY